MSTKKVVHCKKDPFDVYIGRGSKWGNPFKIGKDGDRTEVIKKYAAWILTQLQLMKALPELEGKVLGCWCAPKACHGDVLVQLIQEGNKTTDIAIKAVRLAKAPAAFQTKEEAKATGATWILAHKASSGFASRLACAAEALGILITPDTEVKPGDIVYVSVPGAGRGFKMSPKCIYSLVPKLLEASAVLRTDNEANALRTHNRKGEGSLRIALLSTGCHEETNPLYSEWMITQTPIDIEEPLICTQCGEVIPILSPWDREHVQVIFGDTCPGGCQPRPLGNNPRGATSFPIVVERPSTTCLVNVTSQDGMARGQVPLGTIVMDEDRCLWKAVGTAQMFHKEEDDWAASKGWLRLGIPKMIVDHVDEPTWVLNFKSTEPYKADETRWDLSDLGEHREYDHAYSEMVDDGKRSFPVPLIRTSTQGINLPASAHRAKKPFHSSSACYTGFQGDRRFEPSEHERSNQCDKWLRNHGFEPRMEVAIGNRFHARIAEEAAPLTTEELALVRARPIPFNDTFWDRAPYRERTYWDTYERIGDHFKLTVHPDGEDVAEGMLGGIESFESSRVPLAI